MKVIEGGKKHKAFEVDDMEAAALRAQGFARKAIIGFIESEAETHPEGDGIVGAIAMQAGFLMSVIEAGFIALRDRSVHYDRDYFVGLAGSVFDDVANRENE